MKARAYLLGGALALVAGAVLFSGTPSQPSAPRRTLMDIATRVIDYVARGESKGKFWAQNRNTDGQGLSYGILQWTQRGGGLGTLLEAMYASDPEAFTDVFGPDAGLLRRTTASSSEATRMSLPLWQEPWTSRFTAAGQVYAFQLAQAKLAASGASWKAAVAIAELLQVHTERAMVLFFDRANHHGSYGAQKLARACLANLISNADQDSNGDIQIEYGELLASYAAQCAAPYYRASAPSELVTASGKTWKQVGREWHLFAGKADLYEIIMRRTGEILHDPALADDELNTANV